MTTTPTLWRAKQQANTSNGPEFADDQYGIRMVGLANGNFIALWEDNSDVTDGDNGTDIIGQLYDAEGNRIGAEFQANAGFVNDNEGRVTAAALRNGNFVIVYEDTTAAGTSIRFNIRDATGGLVSTGTILADPGADLLGDPTVTAAADSGFLVTYQRDNPTDVDTYVVKVSNTGVVGSPRLVIGGSDEGFQTDAAALTGGNFVVVSRRGAADDAIAIRLINSAGTPIGFTSSIVADTGTNGEVDSAPSVAALTGGGFVVAWQNADASNIDVQFQIFNATGGRIGGVVTVNNDGATDYNTAPEAIGLADGGFAIVHDDFEDFNGNAIRLQRFNAAGNEVGKEVTVSTIGDSGPVVSLTDDGRLLVGWTTLRPFELDVEFSILDPRETIINGGKSSEQITSRIGGATVNGNGGNDTLFGQGAVDTLNGGLGNDILLGRGGGDTLQGGAGNDTLDGGAGVDGMSGGLGDDGYTVDAAGEAIEAAGEGNDTVNASVSYNLGDNLERLYLLGAGTINGVGNDLNNVIAGNGGGNVLNGRAGIDTLTGNGGIDRFMFNTALNAATNVDTITDFAVGADEIRLDDAVFTGLALGALAAAAFRAGAAAADADDRIIYNAATGRLIFDSNGNSAGGDTHFATLDTGLAPAAGDFEVV